MKHTPFYILVCRMKDRVSHISFLLTFTFTFLLTSCSLRDKHTVVEQRDSARLDSSSNVLTKPSVRHLDPIADIAKYIAGVSGGVGGRYAELEQNASWKKYTVSFGQSWAKLDSLKLGKMRRWSDRELHHSNGEVIFYPFSGPDFLNVHCFFPDASRYVMAALEPVGSVPDLTKLASRPDTLDKYFSNVNGALYSLLNFSFFRTINMAEDLSGDKELDGVLPVLLIFLTKTGNTVTGIHPVEMTPEGTLKERAMSAGKSADGSGVEIAFVSDTKLVRDSAGNLGYVDSSLQYLDYFSVNIADQALKKNDGFVKYAEQLPSFSTYLKSASYLMHKNYFSMIRKVILTHSNSVLQDDSGVPFRFFSDPNDWSVTLYGMYSKPIPLFGNWYQEDLKAAFGDSVHVKRLDFGIGYNWIKGQSNLLLATKKKSGK